MAQANLSAYNHFLQLAGILNRIAGLIIIKVAKDLFSLPVPGGKGSRPTGQRLGVVTTLIGATGAMQSHIDQVGGDRLGRKATNSSSSITGMSRACASSSLEPAPGPATT